MPHQMDSLSVQGPPIATKSLLNYSPLQTSNKPYFQGCLHSVAVFFQLCSRDVSRVFPFEILHQIKQNVKFINLLFCASLSCVKVL